jgi:hypothetical protein
MNSLPTPRRRCRIGPARRAVLWAAAALLPIGCSSPPVGAHLPAPLPAATGPALVVEAPPPARPTPAIAPEPVYRNPKIAMVYLRAHQDAQGRLFGPQIMYQVIDPGSWNVDAVEQGKGYISAVNLEVPPSVGSPYVVPAREVPASPPASPLLDPAAAAKITLTGLGRPEDKPQAEALARRAGDGCTAIYDDQVGWLLVPRP